MQVVPEDLLNAIGDTQRRLMARHHASFMALAWTTTTAGTSARVRVTRASRIIVARLEPVRVVQRAVVVIRHHLREQQLDVEPLRRLDQAVGERVVHRVVGPHQEHPLRAPPREESELPGQDRTWA